MSNEYFAQETGGLGGQGSFSEKPVGRADAAQQPPAEKEINMLLDRIEGLVTESARVEERVYQLRARLLGSTPETATEQIVTDEADGIMRQLDRKIYTIIDITQRTNEMLQAIEEVI